ncbi:MFS transporter [Salinicoccus sesuvii]|uniref:MFS transporter n=1 Tax=Salinicoccus sesuvii TaxID=868281 RepID=A0ABV7N6R3_9STAP
MSSYLRFKHAFLLLLSVGVSNLGAWIYLIALNLMVLDMTGSVLAISLLYIMMPIAALCTNFWSGSFIDRLNKRTIMIFLNLIRASLVFFLPHMDSIIFIYVLVFVINIAVSIFEPTSMVYMTELIPKEDRIRFNALRNFINSSGFILGPSIAGFLFIIGSPETAIKINAVVLVISTLFLLCLPSINSVEEDTEKIGFTQVVKDWAAVVTFVRANLYTGLMYFFFNMMIVFMTALDSLEAAFATTVLLLSESQYGFLVSVAGIGVISGSLTIAALGNRISTRLMISFGAFTTPIGYMIFGYSQNFIWAAIGFFILTFALSFANTGFLTFYQNSVSTSIMGRFLSMFGMVEALMIIVFTVTLGMAADQFDIRLVYIIGTFSFLFLGIIVNILAMLRSDYLKEGS